MFCMKCGTKLPDDANFCYKCGYSFGKIINNEEKKLTNVIVPETETKLVPAKCTNCNASLDVDPNKDAAICPYCNSAFIVSKAINNISINNNVNIDKATISLEGGSVTIKNQVDADNLILRAKEMTKQGNYENADEYLNKALDQDPNNPHIRNEVRNIYLMRALIQSKAGFEEALKSVSNALLHDIDEKHYVITQFCLYVAVGTEKRLLLATEPFSVNEYIKILHFYKKAFELEPSNQSIKDSIKRLEFIATKYEYIRVKEDAWLLPDEVYLLLDNMKYVGFDENYWYSQFTYVGRAGENVVYNYLGEEQKTIRVKGQKAEKLFELLTLFSKQKTIAPSYEVLEKEGLIGKDKNNNYFFPTYSEEEVNKLIKEIG